MYQRVSINLQNLILSMSDALDLASPALSQHQLRTAFIAWEMSKAVGLPPGETGNLFIASLLHDIGALSLEEKIGVHDGSYQDVVVHPKLGALVLRRMPFFESAADVISMHHADWETVRERSAESAVRLSQILHLADLAERLIDRSKYILFQNQDILGRIQARSGTEIDPAQIDVFRSISDREDFWLDLVSPRLYSLLLHDGPIHGIEIDLKNLKPISEMFRNVIDFRSRFTATHSTGVATAASELSKCYGLTEMEVGLMEVAGNFHDVGKMVIPNAILDKPDRLIPSEVAVMRQHTYFTYMVMNTIGGILQIAEWAAFHHERLDGTGYPFHLDGENLNIGSRIMAVADIFTALTEDRPYRKGLSQTEVLAILRDWSAKNYIDSGVLNTLQANFEQVSSVTQKRQAEIKEFYEQDFLLR
jgi:HD-GYP domain-containing protein (c-di-GMP phosphodiesterase class II)